MLQPADADRRRWMASLPGSRAVTALRRRAANCTGSAAAAANGQPGSPTRRPVQYGAAPPSSGALSAQPAG